jgi:ribonuclease PH
VLDFDALGERTLWVDCDVLQADGGTRCASISGRVGRGRAALGKAGLSRALPESVAGRSRSGSSAASCCSTSDYVEDSGAEVDLNVVMTGDERLVEVQATAERATFDRAQLDELLDLGAAGIARSARAGGGARCCCLRSRR